MLPTAKPKPIRITPAMINGTVRRRITEIPSTPAVHCPQSRPLNPKAQPLDLSASPLLSEFAIQGFFAQQPSPPVQRSSRFASSGFFSQASSTDSTGQATTPSASSQEPKNHVSPGENWDSLVTDAISHLLTDSSEQATTPSDSSRATKNHVSLGKN